MDRRVKIGVGELGSMPAVVLVFHRSRRIFDWRKNRILPFGCRKTDYVIGVFRPER
jgi:hypothetical protein